MANYKIIIPFILSREGGMSNKKTDTASSNTWPNVYLGQTGWHTNKGVTRTTFLHYAPILGYPATFEHFVLMPISTWNKIFKTGYWDTVKSDLINNQAIADFIAEWNFGSGTNAARNVQQVLKRSFNYPLLEDDGIVGKITLNAINEVAAKNAKEFLRLLQLEKLDYYDQIVKFNPSQSANIKGWLSRADALFTSLSTYVGLKKKARK
jgi:lysozyme family protein